MEVYDPPNRTGKCNSLRSTRRLSSRRVGPTAFKSVARKTPDGYSRHLVHAQWHEESGANHLPQQTEFLYRGFRGFLIDKSCF